MAICTFLGHRDIYEKGLYTRLSEVMREIVLQNKEVEFLFCSSGPFYDLCLAAALEVKQRFPEKSITITWVVNADERELFVKNLTQYEARIPTCMIDKVISPSLPTSLSEPDCIVAHKRVMRWAIQQSTHLISYLYFAFCETENRQYTYAHHRGLTILDVACKDTASYISQRVNALPERQQLITKKVAQEQPQKDIGQLLGITTSAVRQELKQACRSLRAAAKAMIDQSDFCICNLCENPLAGSIKRHISKTKGAKLLDISQKCVGAV